MITMRLLNSPGYPTVNPNYLGTVHRYRDGAFAVGVNEDYASTWEVRRYLGGAEPPNYPMPAINGHVVNTGIAVYIADPVGYGCNACWSKQAGKQTI